jgi:hypothetical protein
MLEVCGCRFCFQALLTDAEGDTFFKTLSETRKARIEVHQQHCVVRITADKTTAEYTADDVEKAIISFHVTKLRLKLWKPFVQENKVQKDRGLATLYTQEQLDMVSSLTRVGIQKMNSGDSVSSIPRVADTMLILAACYQRSRQRGCCRSRAYAYTLVTLEGCCTVYNRHSRVRSHGRIQ